MFIVRSTFKVRSSSQHHLTVLPKAIYSRPSSNHDENDQQLFSFTKQVEAKMCAHTV